MYKKTQLEQNTFTEIAHSYVKNSIERNIKQLDTIYCNAFHCLTQFAFNLLIKSKDFCIFPLFQSVLIPNPDGKVCDSNFYHQSYWYYWLVPLLCRHNGCDVVSNHQPHGCLLNRSFTRRPKKTSKLCVTGLCAGNSPETGEFPAQMASNAENVSI